MFGSKKPNKELEAYKADQKRKALAAIDEAFADFTIRNDYHYIVGLLDMAFAADIITMNERAAAKDRATEILEAIKLKEKEELAAKKKTK